MEKNKSQVVTSYLDREKKMNKILNVIESDKAGLTANYVNAFRAFSAPEELILELAFVDHATSIRKSEAAKKPLTTLDAEIRGRFIIRPNQIQMLIDTLQTGLNNYKELKKENQRK
jgi:hypothetical protein